MTEGKDRVTYEFGNDHRLAKREANGTPVFYSYTPEGWLRTKSMGAPLGEVATTAALANIHAPVAWLRYEYDADGRIAAREVNGQRYRYEYDAKDQLVAVIDNFGQDAERYFYDPAGNIQTKVIHGIRTAYTYDAANQIMTATDNEGVATIYVHDAAGRLTKEGDKEYIYGFLDKVLKVQKNKETAFTYDYWANGQLRSTLDRQDNNKIDLLFWDGMSLFRRNETIYLNENNYVDGTPVLANGAAIFEDVLGNSLGVIVNGEYKNIERTAFGSKISDGSNEVPNEYFNFFTGKPFVFGLGHVFLLRNYRQDLGRWLSSDPLGYPDKWNGLTYGFNSPLTGADLYGAVWVLVTDQTADISLGAWSPEEALGNVISFGVNGAINLPTSPPNPLNGKPDGWYTIPAGLGGQYSRGVYWRHMETLISSTITYKPESASTSPKKGDWKIETNIYDAIAEKYGEARITWDPHSAQFGKTGTTVINRFLYEEKRAPITRIRAWIWLEE